MDRSDVPPSDISQYPVLKLHLISPDLSWRSKVERFTRYPQNRPFSSEGDRQTFVTGTAYVCIEGLVILNLF